MAERVHVYVYAHDPVTQSGVAAELRGRPGISVVGQERLEEASVALVTLEEVDEEGIRIIRALQRGRARRIVLVVTRPDEAGLLTAVEAGVNGLLRRSEATAEALERAILAASKGDGSLPPDLLGSLLSAVGRLHQQVLHPRGLTFTGLTKREVDVLRLVAEGNDTSEIANQLCYSERTIKNVIHDITMRLNLRNRTHAVAYALRQGLI